MLEYNGKLYFDKPLSEEELSFLRIWQNKLSEISSDYRKASSKDLKERISQQINSFSGINFNDNQRWVIFFGMSPMISFEKDYIELSGSSKKGNMREALLAYQHFFLGEDPVLKYCMGLDFLKEHKFNGIIESSKYENGGVSNWCYIVENDSIFSVDAPTIAEYQNNPKKWQKIEKKDTFYDKLILYFPPLIKYAEVKKSIDKHNELKDKPIKKTSKMKV